MIRLSIPEKEELDLQISHTEEGKVKDIWEVHSLLCKLKENSFTLPLPTSAKNTLNVIEVELYNTDKIIEALKKEVNKSDYVNICAVIDLDHGFSCVFKSVGDTFSLHMDEMLFSLEVFAHGDDTPVKTNDNEILDEMIQYVKEIKNEEAKNKNTHRDKGVFNITFYLFDYIWKTDSHFRQDYNLLHSHINKWLNRGWN